VVGVKLSMLRVVSPPKEPFCHQPKHGLAGLNVEITVGNGFSCGVRVCQTVRCPIVSARNTHICVPTVDVTVCHTVPTRYKEHIISDSPKLDPMAHFVNVATVRVGLKVKCLQKE